MTSEATVPAAGAAAGPLREPGIPLARLTRVELRKTVDTRAGFWLLLVIGLITVAVAVIFQFGADASDQTLTETFRALQWGVSVLLPVVGILAVTSEWSQRTALTTFTLEPRRGKVVLAKALAVVAICIAAVGFTLVIAAISNALTSGDGSWSFSAATLGEAFALQLLSLAVGFAFGLMLQASAPAIVLYFVIPTVVSVVISLVDALDEASEWFDFGTATTVLGEGGVSGTEWGHIAANAAIWFGIPLVVGLYRLSRSELK
jgi:ABC-2 type transport system permease protein